MVDGNRIPAREVLARPREEGLREKEARHPEHWWWLSP